MISSSTEIRVRYADTDQMRMVYYGKFFEYFEQARSDLLRGIGLPYGEIEKLGFYLPVAEASARYLRPARYDDLLVVRTTLADVPQARVRISYQVTDAATGEAIAEGHTVHSFVQAATGRPTRAPAIFIEALRG